MSAAAKSKVAEAIAAGNVKFGECVARGDAVGLAALYTEDGAVLPPGAGILRGRDALASFWKGVLDMGIKAATLTSIEVEEHGDSAVEVGHYVLSGEAAQIIDAGKYIVYWKRVAGEWQLYRDIWNSGQ